MYRPRIVAATAVVAAVGMVLSGGSLISLFGGETTSGGNEPTGEDVAAELAQYYTQELTWSYIDTRVDETRVTVPLDWSDPGGATIEIAVSRHSAPGTPTGSLLINPGGPGGSGFDFVVNSAAYVVTNDVLASYDVIGFDPRGVGSSTPVVCYTDPADQDELLYGTYDVDYGTPEWIDELTERELDWANACLENTGPLLGHLDAASVARDMDVIRALLGDSTLNYLGYSYGTYLGAVYAELFPEKVGRMVLDGAVDPQVSDLEALATQMAGFDSALASYMAWCLSESDCPFTGSVDNGLLQVRDLLDRIDDLELVASDGRQLDSATVGTGIAYTLYSEWSWPSLTGMFAALAVGDADPAFDNADAYYGRYGGWYDGNGNEVYTAVTCNEGDLGTDGVTPLEGVEIIDDRAPILGRYFAYDDYAVLDVACSNWPVPVADLPTSFAANGAPPILVIGTTNDPATPYANAVSLAEQLSSGVLISYEGEGHTIYAHGVSCIDDTVDAYLLRDEVPAADPMC